MWYRYGVWVCYGMYFFVSLIPTMNMDRLVTLLLMFLMLAAHLHMGTNCCVDNSHAAVIRWVRVCMHVCMCTCMCMRMCVFVCICVCAGVCICVSILHALRTSFLKGIVAYVLCWQHLSVIACWKAVVLCAKYVLLFDGIQRWFVDSVWTISAVTVSELGVLKYVHFLA